jgi:hypothetical protein
MQSPGRAYILLTNLAPDFDPLKDYIAGSPSVWVRSPSTFLYNNAPSISSVRPNYARCKRTPILVVPGSGQNLTHECVSFEIDVNGCGYEQKSGFTSFCSFFGNSVRMDGTKVQNAPYTRGKVTSNQQIQCKSPSGTKELRSDCLQFQNSSFVMGPRNFGITEAAISILPRVCALDSSIWFPLAGDSQVQFTFYDDPAFLNLTATTNEMQSSSSTPLTFLRVSTPFARLLHFVSSLH